VTALEAQEKLLLYRPGTADALEPEIAEALRLVAHDEALRRWYEQHCVFQTALRKRFRQIEAPAELKARILAARKLVRPPVWWRSPVWLGAAAALVLVIGLASVLFTPRRPDRFADFEGRMVRTVLREYRMDVVTNDMRQVRSFLAASGAPADYTVPVRLEQLPLTGAGLLRWRSRPVSMVCFDHGGGQMLFLFVMDRAAVKDPPPATPRLDQANKLQTASWSQGDRAYLLAGPREIDLQQYL
jgi:hypothetical protein